MWNHLKWAQINHISGFTGIAYSPRYLLSRFFVFWKQTSGISNLSSSLNATASIQQNQMRWKNNKITDLEYGFRKLILGFGLTKMTQILVNWTFVTILENIEYFITVFLSCLVVLWFTCFVFYVWFVMLYLFDFTFSMIHEVSY